MKKYRLELKKGKMDKKKLLKCIVLSICLIAITILPSYEYIEMRYKKSVELNENTEAYHLNARDTIEQRLIMDKGDRLSDLRIWLSADTAKTNEGKLEITLKQGESVSVNTVEMSQVVGEEYVPLRLDLSKFDDGELVLTINPTEWGGQIIHLYR